MTASSHRGSYGFIEDPQNPGGYRVYDNVVGRMFELKAGASFDFVNGPNGNQTANVEASLYATTGGFYEATDGTALITKWQVWNNDAMCGGEGCQMVFDWAPCLPLMPCANDDCPTVACNSNTPVLNRTWSRASGSGAPNGYRMAHELGHCQYGMHDEYVAGGNVCGHGIMNGPIGGINVADYCSGHRAECPQGQIFPNGNHNSDCQGVAPGTVATDPEGGWTMVETCRPDQVVHYLPTGVPATPDPERFLFSDVWKIRNHSVMERQNY